MRSYAIDKAETRGLPIIKITENKEHIALFLGKRDAGEKVIVLKSSVYRIGQAISPYNSYWEPFVGQIVLDNGEHSYDN